MADPMTPERLAEIREHVAWTRDRYNCVDDFHHAGARAVLDLLAEVERLRAALAVQTEQREIARATAEGLRAELATATREHRRNTLAAEAALDRIESLIGDRQQAERDAGEAIGRANKAEAERDRLADEVRKAAAYLFRRADLAADLSPSESRALATELRNAAALDGTEAT